MNLWVNQLLEWQSDEADIRVERVLWIDLSGTDAVTIELRNTKAIPTWKKCLELEAAITASLVRILQVDPYAALNRPESEIAPGARQRRDEAWKVIAPLVANGEQMFIPSVRGQLVATAVKRTGRTKPTIYKDLRRYWQGGQTKNALLPLFDRCGGRGRERQSHGRKRGRPSQLSQSLGEPKGVNVDADIRERLLRGAFIFHEKQGKTLKAAYELTMQKFFNSGYELINGVLLPILPSAEERPTYRQFQYWYEKHRDLAKAVKAREGQRRFNLRYRPLLGDSTQMAFGPGSLWQIDATIGDIYLVSSLDRNRIIGRPVIYLIVDVFSRMIVGFSVSLEGPSWLGAMLALENAMANKVEFCREYGFEITEFQWPCHHLPEAILGDRGELEGYNADNLVNALNVRVANTPPYRPDWKPVVERYFRLSNDKMIHWIPGALNRTFERGDRDYRLDAILDLDQFRKLMLIFILDHNNQHRLESYRMDEFMITDRVEPYPVDLWHWGVKNRVGHLRTMAPEIIRLNLLPSAAATVTPKGIRFNNLFYTCEDAVREQWFVKARIGKNWKIKIVYDPRRLDTIYLRRQGGVQMEVCHLLPISKTFKGRDWHEAIDYLALQEQEKLAALTRTQQAQAVFHAQVEQIVNEATEQAQTARAGQSKRSRLKNIRLNRQLEREAERQTGAVQFSPAENSAQSELIIPLSESSQNSAAEEGYVPPPQALDKLRNLREHSWNNEQ